MNNLDWLCENDREQLMKLLTEGDSCEYCAFEIEDDCGVRCDDGVRVWLEAEHNDGSETENVVSDEGGDSNDVEVVLNREKYKLADADTREKLMDDIRASVNADDAEEYTQFMGDVESWLDRQAAITERKLCKGCDWPYLAAQPDQEAYDRIAELEAELEKRDKGIARLKAKRDEARAERDDLRGRLRECDEQRLEYRDQRDWYREKLCGAVAHAQAIAGMMEVDW